MSYIAGLTRGDAVLIFFCGWMTGVATVMAAVAVGVWWGQ